jgi:hypothetical protein
MRSLWLARRVAFWSPQRAILNLPQPNVKAEMEYFFEAHFCFIRAISLSTTPLLPAWQMIAASSIERDLSVTARPQTCPEHRACGVSRVYKPGEASTYRDRHGRHRWCARERPRCSVLPPLPLASHAGSRRTGVSCQRLRPLHSSARFSPSSRVGRFPPLPLR